MRILYFFIITSMNIENNEWIIKYIIFLPNLIIIYEDFNGCIYFFYIKIVAIVKYETL